MRDAGGLGRADQRMNVVFMTVNAAVGQQAHDVQRRVLGLGDRRAQHRVGGETAVLDVAVDAADVLLHHAAGADVQMADFRVAELAGGQADEIFRGIDGAVGKVWRRRFQLGIEACRIALSSPSVRWPKPSRINNNTGLMDFMAFTF